MCNGKLKVLVRADASAETGVGHIMRCFALAETFQDMGSDVVFLCFRIPAKLERLLEKANIELVRFYDDLVASKDDAELMVQIAQTLDVDWIIADGYSFDENYQRIVKENDFNLMVIDDYGHAEYYPADIVMNPGLIADENYYLNREAYTRLLLGPKYFPLRKEFLNMGRCSKEISPSANKILVTMGGSDPRQATLKVVESLAGLDSDLQICVVAGPSYVSPDRLKNTIDDSQILLLQNVENMAALMSWADIGISAGGGTLAEMAYMGLPNIIIKTAANQYASVFYEQKAGTSLFLGDVQEVTNDHLSSCVKSLCQDYLKRQEMSANGRKLIDGEGGKRVFEFLCQSKLEGEI